MAILGQEDGFAGSPETYTVTNSIAAESATLALTTPSMLLVASRNITCDALSLTLTGTDAILLKTGSYALSVDPAAFVLTGTAAALTYANYRIAATSRSYALSGTVMAFKAGRKLVCASGSFALTGTSATVTKRIPFELQPASFTVTLGDAQLDFSRYTTWIIQDRQSSSWQAA